jgi:5'-nucleotidase
MTSQNTPEQQPWILVTNDDGPDSPALIPLLRELSGSMPVRALVPSREYSWSAKTLTRQGNLQIAPIVTDGFELSTLTGSPADCANLGVHHLAGCKPSLVVSGVNMGTNAGNAFMLSSGTVGAAIEGALCGVAAAAFSMKLSPQVYQQWRAQRSLDSTTDELWATAAIIAREICEEILHAGLPAGASLLSVNMPDSCATNTPRRFARITPTEYGSFFKQLSPNEFDHRYSGFRVVGGDGQGDVELLENGVVTLAAIDLDLNAEAATDGDRQRFERSDLRSQGQC